MDLPDSRLPDECRALIHELFTKDIMDDYDEEFGCGGFAFITNGRLYKLSFRTEDGAEHGVRPYHESGRN
jgi:hypothetical protein